MKSYINIPRATIEKERLINFLTQDFVRIDELLIELKKINIDIKFSIKYNLIEFKKIISEEIMDNELSLDELEYIAKKIILKDNKYINIENTNIYYKGKVFLIKELIKNGYFGKISKQLKPFLDYKNIAINECVNNSKVFKYFEEFGLPEKNLEYHSIIFYVLYPKNQWL